VQSDLTTFIGLGAVPSADATAELRQLIHLRLARLGYTNLPAQDVAVGDLFAAVLAHERESGHPADAPPCPADQRIQEFLDSYLAGMGAVPRLPGRTLVLDRHGMARALSLPLDGDEFRSDIIRSYRARNGVLHNPKADRRTTAGIFHVAEGGLPIPDDKLALPRAAFTKLLAAALRPPAELLRLPYTANQLPPAECFVSLLLRPVVCPEVPGFIAQKTMETRFFAPGNLVSNLDFVESIFGNAGDPALPENDAALDVEHWTGHTGCVILAPHLIRCTKKELGLPHVKEATERQRRDGMCWEKEGDLYNGGNAFKATARDARGVMVTIIADNYFGYCKKEVKTQLGYAANLFGLAEEEHAGGARVFASYDLGWEFSGDLHVQRRGHSFEEVARLYAPLMHLRPEGYGVDREFPEIIYVPENVHFDLHNQSVSWTNDAGAQRIKLLPGHAYVRPSGYKVRMEKPPGDRAWRLVGTAAEPVLCHKPCTVSGGGKSEISKPITDAIIQGPVFVADIKRELDYVSRLLKRDYAQRFRDAARNGTDHRAILSPERSLGSVIKLLTPAPDYTDEYNEWLESVPQYIKELVFVLKRFYKPDWGDDWRSHFSVDVINGVPGNELKLDGRKLVANYLRVGFEADGSWRVFGLRKDFFPATKLQAEDDITASVVVPAAALVNLDPDQPRPSVKFVHNCEYRLFQRPDDAVHRGYDKVTEADFAKPGNFFSNYEPLTREQARELIEDAIGFDKFTPPMQRLVREAAASEQPCFFVSTAHPRLVDGKPSKNPRYLQTRPDLLTPREKYLAEVGVRLRRRVPLGQPVHTPVTAVLPGRRNNPPDHANKIRPLAVYGPIHYMELPELFMEFICSMTGKSPSTTGAGSEGALTKGPFNALPPIYDLNAALVSYILTDSSAFITAAGCVGPHLRVDHDVSLLVPEVWARMTPEEREPRYLIEHGFLERCEDYTHAGQKLLSSRLGWRITPSFITAFFGRVFNHPHVVFSEKMLRPEQQDWEVFADGMENIVSTQRRVAEHYFNDGSVELACPPLRALLQVMRHDTFEGKDLNHPELRALFRRDTLLASDWYARRLAAKQTVDVALHERHLRSLEQFLATHPHADAVEQLDLRLRQREVEERLRVIRRADYLKQLHGTIGAEPAATAN
jgi:hypothetical protein